MRGDFKGSDEPYKDAVVTHGKGKVDTHNLRKMYLTACKTGKVRENISPRNHPANTPQSPRNHLAHRTPPLQGQRSVSAPPRTATEAGQPGKALQHCLDAVSTAFTAREVSGWCMSTFMYVPCPFAVDIVAVTDCAACEPMLPIALADEK